MSAASGGALPGTSSKTSRGPSDGALSGIRVLDLSSRLSGAFCGRLLGDMGADVVLVEDAEGHALRGHAPFLDGEAGVERSLLHHYANFNKRSAVLPAGDQRITDLLARADVVLVNDRATLEAARPHTSERAILAAITPYGLTGPRADAPGNDLTAYAASGWASMNGEEGKPPLKGSMNQVGYLSGLLAYNGIVAALVERDASGLGQDLDVSELECLTLVAGPNLLAATYEGRSGDRALPDIFGGPVPTRDGYISITFSRAHFWRDAMNALGLPELAEDPRYIDTWTRRQYRGELAPQIEAQVADRERWEVFELLSTLRCVCGVVLDVSDLATNEHLHEREALVETNVLGRTVKMPGAPFKLSATPWVQRRPAPCLGEHTAEVLADWKAAQ